MNCGELLAGLCVRRARHTTVSRRAARLESIARRPLHVLTHSTGRHRMLDAARPNVVRRPPSVVRRPPSAVRRPPFSGTSVSRWCRRPASTAMPPCRHAATPQACLKAIQPRWPPARSCEFCGSIIAPHPREIFTKALIPAARRTRTSTRRVRSGHVPPSMPATHIKLAQVPGNSFAAPLRWKP